MGRVVGRAVRRVVESSSIWQYFREFSVRFIAFRYGVSNKSKRIAMLVITANTGTAVDANQCATGGLPRFAPMTRPFWYHMVGR